MVLFIFSRGKKVANEHSNTTRARQRLKQHNGTLCVHSLVTNAWFDNRRHIVKNERRCGVGVKAGARIR